MSETSASVRGQAIGLERNALEARRLADDLSRRHVGLEGRLSGVLALHTAATWDSRAALASRDRLRIGGIAALGRARDALLEVIAALRARADGLEADAVALRRHAAALDAEAAHLVPESGAGDAIGAPPRSRWVR